MSTLSNALRGLLIAGSLLAANTTPASDASADRQILSLQDRTRAADRKGPATPVDGDAMKSATAQPRSSASAKDAQHGAPGHRR